MSAVGWTYLQNHSVSVVGQTYLQNHSVSAVGRTYLQNHSVSAVGRTYLQNHSVSAVGRTYLQNHSVSAVGRTYLQNHSVSAVGRTYCASHAMSVVGRLTMRVTLRVIWDRSRPACGSGALWAQPVKVISADGICERALAPLKVTWCWGWARTGQQLNVIDGNVAEVVASSHAFKHHLEVKRDVTDLLSDLNKYQAVSFIGEIELLLSSSNTCWCSLAKISYNANAHTTCTEKRETTFFKKSHRNQYEDMQLWSGYYHA